MCSVNQIHGQIKLLEMWKAVNVEKNPIKGIKVTNCKDLAKTRSGGNERLVERGKSSLAQEPLKMMPSNYGIMHQVT